MNKTILLPAGMLALTGMLITVMEAAATTGYQRQSLADAVCPLRVGAVEFCTDRSLHHHHSTGNTFAAAALLNTYGLKTATGFIKDHGSLSSTDVHNNQ
ncbi:hypothetical protein [Paraflavitalea sp. CAU 1676]|uniref:hypothetical protein n=1 Tax=Paraflavitalea sp. CAU 1676 TaxID=3032598 RepID=UPI0023DA9624|nr:hypothetical protein [Paraflavitalea sp. CAU 1676]MDF2189925.1 hypothetical protein [Paraflavitalea sp. CAU 1676]